MNKIVISFLIILSSSIYSQFTKVVYQEINIPKVKIIKGNSFAIKTVNASRKLRGHINLELYFNDTKALFKREDRLIRSEDKIAHILASSGLLPSQVYFHDIKTNALITDGQKVNYPQKEYEWKSTGKTKTILGYTCYEAIAKTEYYDTKREIDVPSIIRVWYTKEIKKRWGPFKLINLPGLVLECKTGQKRTYGATKITTVKKFPKVPKYSEEKTYLQYNKELDERYEKINKRMKKIKN